MMVKRSLVLTSQGRFIGASRRDLRMFCWYVGKNNPKIKL